MPSCSTAKHPSGVEIVFTEGDHKYITTLASGDTIQYVSGTTFLSKYFPPFDPTGEITARCAKKEGISVAEIQAKWREKGIESSRIGTRTHETVEDTLLGREYRNVAENPAEERRFSYAKAVGQKIRAKYDIIGVEKIVFSPELRIAGTIDLLVKSRENGNYAIIDHKTNAKIEVENTFNKFCNSPISHLADTNFIHYALQLNLYQYLLKVEKYVPASAKFSMFLNHLTENGQKWYQLPDLQSEIKDLMIDYLIDKACYRVQTDIADLMI